MDLNKELDLLRNRYKLDEQQVQKLLFKKLQLEQQEKSLPRKEGILLAQRIRPVMSKENGKNIPFPTHLVTVLNEYRLPLGWKPSGEKSWVSGQNIFTESYVCASLPQEQRLLAPAKGLVPIAEIDTYHNCMCWQCITPTVYEVLYQIPEVLRGKATAFELYAETDILSIVYDDYLRRHKLRCILYEGSMPQKVFNSQIIV